VIAREPEPGVAKPRIVGELRIGGIPADGTLFEDSIWVPDTDAGTLVRVDPADRAVLARVEIGGQPEFVAGAADGGLWVHGGAGAGPTSRLSRIDPDADRVVRRITTAPEGPMTVGGGSVWSWVGATDDNDPPSGLYRFDAGTGEQLGRLSLSNPDRLAAAGDDVWALEVNGTLVRIGATSGRIERELPQLSPGTGTAAGAHALAADAGGAWVLSTPQAGEGELLRVEDDAVARRLPLPASALPVLAIARDSLWVAVGNDLRAEYEALRLDPRSGRVTARVDLRGHRPVALVAAGDELWAVGGDGTLVAIGS
jgi:hypothetical protein